MQKKQNFRSGDLNYEEKTLILFHLQEDLQLALRVSSEEDLGGDGDSDGDLVRQPKGQKKEGTCEPSKKQTGLAVITDEGSIVLGDSDDEGLVFEVFFPILSVCHV